MATHSFVVFLPGKSHGQRRLAGLHSLGSQESDRTERLNNNNETEQTQNNFRDKIIKIGYYKQWKKIKN